VTTAAAERIEVPVGEHVFDALASGPPDGELVVLLHGFPESSYEWRSQLAALAEAGYRAVAPDQRGYSPRARPEGAEHYRAESLVSDVLAIADWSGGHRFHLVGHDWGAVVAWHVAARHPARVRTLTAGSVPHPMAMAEALGSATGAQLSMSSYVAFFQRPELPERILLADGGARLRELFTASGLTDDDAIGRYLALLTEPEALTAALNWYRALDLSTARADDVEVPTLFLWGDEDPAIGHEAAEACAAHVTGPYRFELMEGAGHWLPETESERFTALLLEHLAQGRDVDAVGSEVAGQ